MKKITFLFLSWTFISMVGFSQVISDFEIENDTEGWHSEGDGDYNWESGTGNPGNCFRVNDDATGDMNRAYAPVKFLGDWSAATTSDYVSADIFLHDAGGGYVTNNFVFRIVGPGGSAKALYNPYPQPPNDTWITYSVNLDETLWGIESGTWAGILSHVSSFIVTMEYITGDEWNRMDNVILSISPVTVPIAPGLCSDFESGLFEGWSTIDATKSIINSGGNPGKYLQVNDETGTSLIVPSSSYHGDWSSLDNHNAEIQFDIKVTDIDGATYLHDFFVKIAGPGGEATFPIDNSIENAFNKWHSFGIPIESTGWTMLSGDWSSLMNFVDDIQIIAEFISGDETVGIDNFCISDSPPVADFMTEKTYVYQSETVQFLDQSTSGPQMWEWDFGDSGTSTEVNPTHQFMTPGFYTVTLTTTNYYGNSTEIKTNYIEVYTVDPVLCSDFESGLFEGWSVESSGGASIASSGGNPGRYLKINDGGGNSIALPSSRYYGDWSSLDGHNAEIHMDYLITDIVGTLYLHDFFVKISGPGGEATFPIDNSIENAFNKWHSFGIPIESTGWTMLSGNWSSLMNLVDNIQIVAEFIDGSETVGIDNFCISNSPPVSNFLAEKTFIYLGETTKFFDQSTSAPQTWDWDFGDLNTSTEVNPEHIYTEVGTYTVSLTTSNYYGNSTETKTTYIEVYPLDQCLKYDDNFDDNIIHPAWSFKNGTWSESNGNMRQTSNHNVSNNYLEGCFAIAGSASWEDYIVSCDFESTDNDIIGFVFNYQDEQNMYMFRWRLDPLYRGLYKYENGVETELALDDVGYVKNIWYHADIYSLSGTIVLVIDGVEIFAVNDNTFANGKVGLYCWGNQSSYFDNFKVECAGTPVELSVFAEGPIVGNIMNTELNSENLLPVINPYISSPWNYTETEGVLHYSNPDIVDWVLVDFRDATSASNALPATSVETKAGLLLSDGQIISPYGGLPLFFNKELTNSLYAVVWHRNHLGVLSADPLMDFGGALLYDFTSAASQAYGTNAQKDFGNGIFGMYAGDLNADGIIDALDKELTWEIEAGKSGYVPSDCNLDGQADNLDKNDLWIGNTGKYSEIPE